MDLGRFCAPLLETRRWELEMLLPALMQSARACLATCPRRQNMKSGRLSTGKYLELKGLGARRQGFERGALMLPFSEISGSISAKEEVPSAISILR
ncbi:hypothetical protein LEMLEM_LOCUS22306, partial [Lemmus lemmus]